MPGYDLHTHTFFSDGTTSPEDNVAQALAVGLSGLAVTDHDTTAALDRARAAAEGTALEVVPGVEFSAELEGGSVHVLGYWIDPADPTLSTEMERVRAQRDRRAADMVERLNALGIPVTLEGVRAHAGQAPIGRPHIAAAVVDTGAARDVDEVFSTWLYDGGPAYVPKYAVTPQRAVGLIRGAGGVAVLAHPGLYGRDGHGIDEPALDVMVEAGMAGLEVDHPAHPPATRLHYRDLARHHGLVTVAGSDFHGAHKSLALGQATTGAERLEELRARRPRRPRPAAGGAGGGDGQVPGSGPAGHPVR